MDTGQQAENVNLHSEVYANTNLSSDIPLVLMPIAYYRGIKRH